MCAWRKDRSCSALSTGQRCGQLVLIRGSIAALITHGRLALAGLSSVNHELDSRPDSCSSSTAALLLYCNAVTHGHFRPGGSLIRPFSNIASEESCAASRGNLQRLAANFIVGGGGGFGRVSHRCDLPLARAPVLLHARGFESRDLGSGAWNRNGGCLRARRQ